MVQAADLLSWFNPVPGGQNATPAAIAEARAYAEALQKPTAPGQSGLYQSYGKFSALADALRGGIGGYTQYAANQAELAQREKAAGGIAQAFAPFLPSSTPAAPSLTSPSGVPPQAIPGEPAPGLAAARAHFAEELKDPALRQHVMAIGAGENNDPTANLAVIESAMNRAAMMGTTLAQEMRHTSQGGYYAGYNPKALSDPAFRSIAERNLDLALGGSNASNFATDNASGNFAAQRVQNGMYASNASHGGESFLHPTGTDARGHERYDAWLKSVTTAPAAAPAAAPGQVAGPGAPGAPPLPDRATTVQAQTFSPTGQQTGGPGMPPPAGAVPPPAAPGGLPHTLTAPSGLDPQKLQAIMANPWIGDTEKAAIQQMVMSRVTPQTVPTVGGQLQYNLQGQQAYIPEPKFGTVKMNGVDVPIVSTYNPKSQAWNHQLMTPGAGTPAAPGAPAAAGMAEPNLSTIGNLQQTAVTQEGRLQGAKTTSEIGAKVPEQINEEAQSALHTRRQLAEVENVGGVINPSRLTEVQATVGNVMQGLGFMPDTVKRWLGNKPGDIEAFNKVSTQLAAEVAKSNFTRVAQQEFLMLLRQGTPGATQTPEGLGRIVDFLNKSADMSLDKVNEFQKWKKETGAGPSQYLDFEPHWIQQQRAKVAAGAYTSAPGAKIGGPQGAPAVPAAPPVAPTGPVPVKTLEEARGLPSGTSIILPDGSPGRVP